MDNNLIIISFCSRKFGNCEQIADFIYKHFNNRTNVSVYKFSDFSIEPCGKCNYECFGNNTACPYFNDMEYTLLDQICGSDMVYFVLPNYCDYPCANFFIFNERSQCYFQNHAERLERYLQVPKKFIVVSNSKAESFTEAFQQHTDAEPRILYLSSKAYGKRSITGDILTAAQAQRDLKLFLEAEYAN